MKIKVQESNQNIKKIISFIEKYSGKTVECEKQEWVSISDYSKIVRLMINLAIKNNIFPNAKITVTSVKAAGMTG